MTETTSFARSVAITGAGSGLGKEIVICFVDKGYACSARPVRRRKSRMCDR